MPSSHRNSLAYKLLLPIRFSVIRLHSFLRRAIGSRLNQLPWTSNVQKYFSRYRHSLKTNRITQIITGSVALVLFSILFFFTILKDLPSPTKLSSAQALDISTKIFDRNGELLYEVYTDKNRTPVALKDLPGYLPQATIAIEDQNFYRHFGFDLSGMIRAVRNTLLKQKLQGGSTITQQLIKTTLLTPQRTFTRKVREGILALVAEILYSKEQILEMYLNNIPYGGTAWGIEAGAQTFFGKPAKDLSLAEAALLAGLPQSPTRYSPFGTNPDLAKARQLEVLRRMVEDKYISQEQADQAGKETLKYATSKFRLPTLYSMYVIC
jgi:membrane peptidoglycan carboxypeptidase